MRVTSTDFQQNVGTYSDAAQREPVIITNHNRDRLVLMSAQDYQRLTGSVDGVSPDQEELMRRGIARHHGTLVELSNR